MKLPNWLWPIRTGKTFFDVWSVVHLAAGLIIGADLFSQDWSLWKTFVGAVVLGYAWELVETFIEWKWPGVVKHPEGKLNRWVSDPWMVVAGAMLGAWLISYQ